LSWALTLVLVVAALAAFARYLATDMVGTDSLAAVRGAHVASWSDFVSAWVRPLNANTSFADTQAVFYRPLATLVFAADYAIWGLNAAGFHLTNTLIHAGVVALAFGMLRALGLSHIAAFCGAALLGFHPSMAAAVPVIARRYDALSAAGLFASVLLLGRAVAADTRGWQRGVPSALAFAAALLCKESAFAAVPLLPLVVVARTGHWRIQRHATLLTPHFVVAASVFAVRYAVLGSLGGHSGSTFGTGLDWGGYELTVGRYLQFLTWPLDVLLPTTYRGAAGLTLAVGLLLAAALVSLPSRLRWVFVLGVGWVVWFGAFFTALLHLSGAWYMYYPLGGVALAVGALIDGCASRVATRQLRAVPLALASAAVMAYAGAALPASPLVRDYQAWHTAGAVTRRVLVDAAACIQRLAPGETITFWNLPRDYLDGTRETEFLAVTMLEDFSMEAYVQLLRPGEVHPIFVGSSVRLAGPVPDLDVRCERPGSDRLRLVATGSSLPTPDLPPFDPGLNPGAISADGLG